MKEEGKSEHYQMISIVEKDILPNRKVFWLCGPAMPLLSDKKERKTEARKETESGEQCGSQWDLKLSLRGCVCSDEIVIRWENRGLTEEDAAMWCLVLTSPCCCGPCETRITTGAKVVIQDFDRVNIRMRRIWCLILDCVYLQYCGMELPSCLLHTTPHVGENAS